MERKKVASLVHETIGCKQGARNFNTILYRVLEISTKTYNLLSRKSKFLRNLYDFIRNFLRKSIFVNFSVNLSYNLLENLSSA